MPGGPHPHGPPQMLPGGGPHIEPGGALPGGTTWTPEQASRLVGLLGIQSGNLQQTPVIICYGLDDSVTTCDHLFNLFSFYGIVTRVKILAKRGDTALIQFADAIFAILAHHFLQGVVIHGKLIRVGFSNNQEVTVPASYPSGRMEDPKTVRTRLYTAEQQRYAFGRTMNDRILRNACHPSPVLHVANIIPTVQEGELTDLFAQYGTVGGVRFLPQREKQESRMALVSMASINEGVQALIHLHNYRLRDRPLKVSFSKQKFDRRPSQSSQEAPSPSPRPTPPNHSGAGQEQQQQQQQQGASGAGASSTSGGGAAASSSPSAAAAGEAS